MVNKNNIVVNLHQVRFLRGERIIFKNLDLKIKKGKVTAILGPSGTGKTTLLHLVGGLLMPDAGRVEVFGQNIPDLSRRKLFAIRRKMGMLFQSGALFTDLSTFDNVAFALREHTKLPENLIRNIVLMKLEAVGLRGAYNLMPSELSGGMAHRVALARAIALDPQIMFYDEPFTGQDPVSMGVIIKLIRTLNDALNLTSVIVSHDVQEVFSIADYAYILSNGEVVGEGTPSELMADKTKIVDQFVHGKPDGPVPFHYPALSIEEDFL